MIIRNREFDTEHNTYIMGILNVTPDSFSDGGRSFAVDDALRSCGRMISEGADIIDIGGESTRPGYKMISADQELERIIPVISAIRREYDIPISVDTYKSTVAAEALNCGADMINDIWGLKYDPNMADVIYENGAACCLMHNKSEPHYNRLIPDICSELLECVSIAEKSGIKKDMIMLDPGIGFGKTKEINLEVLSSLGSFTKLGYPVLLGCSRKSVIGLTLDLPTEERLEGTLVTTVMAVLAGCAFVRVHDIKENVRAVKMTRAILDSKR